MKPSIFVLDSYALMCFFRRERGFEYIETLIHQAKSETCALKLSIINWGEIFYSILRANGDLAAKQALALIDQYPIDLVMADRALTLYAARIKAVHPIAYGDCFAAALAIREGGTIVTGDPEFRKLGDKISIHWLK